MSKPLAATLHAHPAKLKKALSQLLGFRPRRLAIYRQALVHVSAATTNPAGHRQDNERLEYLGDSIISSVVADHLYHAYPLKDEGFLTQVRATIVNRRSLNLLATRVGLLELVLVQRGGQRHKQSFKSVAGNSLEALIGAIYIDRGYDKARQFIIKKLLSPLVDLDNAAQNSKNHKSQLIEWSQREGRPLSFEIVDTRQEGNSKVFVVGVFENKQQLGQGEGFTKKQAEQEAARAVVEKVQNG